MKSTLCARCDRCWPSDGTVAHIIIDCADDCKSFVPLWKTGKYDQVAEDF